MFDIGAGEVVVIAIVGLLVFGPDRLPEMAKQVGGWVRDLRRMVASARSEVSDSLGVDARYLTDPKGSATTDLLGDEAARLPTSRRDVTRGVTRALGLEDEPGASAGGSSSPSGSKRASPDPTDPASAVDPDAT